MRVRAISRGSRDLVWVQVSLGRGVWVVKWDLFFVSSEAMFWKLYGGRGRVWGFGCNYTFCIINGMCNADFFLCGECFV